MSDKLLASIIIDNYNYGHFIGEAIDSALQQSYQNIEVIVVDDGSTDNSREIIRSYGEKIIPVLKNNGGQASAFNAGYYKSTGDVIFFLDSDDTLFPNAVNNALQFFLSNPEITKVQWPLWIVDKNGKRTGETKPSQVPPQGNLREAVLAGGPTSCASSPTSGNAWARHFLEKIFPVPEEVVYYKTCADEYLYTLAPVFGEIKTIAEPQGFYKIHGKNIYAALSFDQKMKLELDGRVEQTAALSTLLRKYGFSIDENKWKDHSWFHRLRDAKKMIESNIPPGSSFILVDEATWDAKEVFPDYKVSSFIEHDGKYWGSPESDEHALEILQKLHEEGTRYIAFGWPSFWWLQEYPKLHDYLRLHFNCIIQNKELIIFHSLKNRC
jgi:glycosyltransferase involved in cell wall biosynthesis